MRLVISLYAYFPKKKTFMQPIISVNVIALVMLGLFIRNNMLAIFLKTAR